MASSLPSATVQALATLAPFAPGVMATRVLHKTAGGSVALLALSEGEGLREHVNTHDALVIVVNGEARIEVAGTSHRVAAGETIRLPGDVPHAVGAVTDLRMLLILLKDPTGTPP